MLSDLRVIHFTGSLLSNMFHSLESGPTHRMGWVLPPLDPESETIASLALNCLTHLFSWIPLSSLITPHLLNTIFLFASLGADPQVSLVIFIGDV